MATDYEGLGTPGIHPYLVGASEGRGVLDVARAAQALRAAHASDRVVVDGHSQGGHAALFAGEIAAKYAPDLHLLGISAGAPVTDVAAFLDSSRVLDGFKGFPVLAAAGYHAVYPHAPLDALFSAEAVETAKYVRHACALGDSVTAYIYANADHSSVLSAARTDVEHWIAARFAGRPTRGCKTVHRSSAT